MIRTNRCLQVSFLSCRAIVSLIFGLIHFAQGPSCIISSFIFGAVMTWLYFLTSRLLLPILLHICCM
ncbi:CPBP family intramembrane glutamic endopeptidase [Paenibacillus chitinolyticus]|uniref:CPBP family intramembrane glutamic endopeptidase n=1 Tax=Paenibacillus chitinolyticus TaxID=79263 RepID=UPI0013E94B76